MSKIEGQNIDPWLEVALGRGQLTSMANGMVVLMGLLPTKISFQQGVAFMILASAHSRKEAMTVTEMVAQVPGFSNAIRAGYNLFVDLGWIEAVLDQQDKRRKVMKLTEAGMAVAVKILNAMGDA